jgi:hypothetical protein
MKNVKILLLLSFLILVIAPTSSCGGGGGGGGITIHGRIVNESSTPLAKGFYLVQGSGTIGEIAADGSFAAASGKPTGRLVLTNSASSFRFRRIPFDTAGEGTLDLGNIPLPNDSLSKAWGAYRGGDLASAESYFAAHISASGRDIKDAKNGLGWTLAKLGRQEEAFQPLLDALGSGFDPEIRTALAMAYFERTSKGIYSIPQAISNLDLAVNDDGFYLSKPLHDDISEDDLIAFRAMLNLLDNRIAAATADRDMVLSKSKPQLNKASEDLLKVVDFFLSH